MQASYREALSKRRLETGGDITNYDAVVAREDVMKKKSAEGFAYRECIAGGKQLLSAGAREFVGAFKTDAAQTKAKDALAQWLTAIDAVSKDNFPHELSRFDAHANALKLELNLQ